MTTDLLEKEEKRKLLQDSLYPGLKLPIFIQQDDGTYNYECEAILVEKLNPLLSPEPYPYIEYSETKVVNAIKEKWKVMVSSDSPFDNGRTAIRWIPRYHSEGIIKIRELIDEDWFHEDDDDNDLI